MKKMNRSTILREQRRQARKEAGSKVGVMYRLAKHFLEVAEIDPDCFACDGTGYIEGDFVCQTCDGTGKYYDASKIAKGLSNIYKQCGKNEEKAKEMITIGGEYFKSKGLSFKPITIWNDWELIQAWIERDEEKEKEPPKPISQLRELK